MAYTSVESSVEPTRVDALGLSNVVADGCSCAWLVCALGPGIAGVVGASFAWPRQLDHCV